MGKPILLAGICALLPTFVSAAGTTRNSAQEEVTVTADRSQAAEMMGEFAARTGLTSEVEAEARRYLWTDAFALLNFLDLYRETRRRCSCETRRISDRERARGARPAHARRFPQRLAQRPA